MATLHYDVVIIGSGAGGGTMAQALADSGARILVLERGDFVPREPENWDPAAVWQQLRYRTAERWVDERGADFQPYMHYCVGGNTKFWGSVLYRLRREDFGELAHLDGVSPAWPIDYDTLAPYYDRAERLFAVRGQHDADPTEPPRGPFPHPPVPHAAAHGRDRRAAPRARGCIRRRCRWACCAPGRRAAAGCATPATRFRASRAPRATPRCAV